MRCRLIIPASINGLVVAVAALAGCDSDSFAPPPPIAPRPSSVSGGIPGRAKEVALILSREDNDESAFIESIARLEAGTIRAVYQSIKPAPGDPPGAQGDLIRRAVADGASAIVVVAEDPKVVAEAIGSIDTKKVPVVLLGRPVPGASGATLVTFPSFAASAKEIVGAIAEAAKKAGFPDDAPVILLKVEPRDETSAARDAAIIEAIGATKHRIVTSILLTNPTDSVRPTLDAAIREHPDLCAVLADTDDGLNLASAARGALKTRGKFLIGGYLLARGNLQVVNSGQVTAVAERNLDGLVRRSIQVAIDRAEGKAVPDRIEVDVPVRRATKPYVPAPDADFKIAPNPQKPG